VNPALDARTLWQLREAAALANAVPVRVTVVDGAHTLLEVVPPGRAAEAPGPVGSRRHRVAPPCWLRALVAHIRAGLDGPDLELLATRTVEIVVELDHRGASLAGGLWRLDHPGSSIYVFATSLRPHQAQAAAGGCPFEVGFMADGAAAVTLVSVAAPGPGPRHQAPVFDLLARCLAEELMAEVSEDGRRW